MGVMGDWSYPEHGGTMASVERDPVVCLGCGESVQRSSEDANLHVAHHKHMSAT